MKPTYPNGETFDFEVGDYVVTTKGTIACLGRVAEVTPGGQLRVCFTTGCTAELVDTDDVMFVGNAYAIDGTDIGFNRFRKTCENRCPWCPPSCHAAGPTQAISAERINHEG